MGIFEHLDQTAFYFLWVRAVVLVLEVFYLLYKKGLNSDVVPNVLCGGIIYACIRFFEAGAVMAMMLWVAQWAPWSLETNWFLVVLTILGADLSFYVYHRSAHRWRIFWADHSVHHSSRELDFTTNLRNSAFSAMYSWWPVAPLLLLGISPMLVVWCRAFVNDYTFFLHTQYVKKLGWFELIFNTPSHHRVHHSRNPQYIDKNFGFMFIFWDKIFGTFAEERETCEFGVHAGPASKNPVKIMLYEWRNLIRDVYTTSGWRNKIRRFGPFA